jgi:membrane protease YdiL (CAAX protease family)
MTTQRKILLCVLPAMILPFTASLFYFVLFADHPVSGWLYGFTKLFTLVWPIIAVLLIEKDSIPFKGLDWKRHFKSLPLGLWTGLGIAGLTAALFEWSPLGAYVRNHADFVIKKTVELGIIDFYIPFAVLLSFLHSLLEEYYWRWYVYGRLSNLLPDRYAIPLASLAFASHHYVIVGTFFSFWGAVFFGTCVGVGGALWCWMFKRQKSLLGCWLSHMWVDIVIFYIGYRLIF